MTWEQIATVLLMLSAVAITLLAGRIAYWRQRCRIEQEAVSDWTAYAEWLEHRGWEVEGQHSQVPTLPEARERLREDFRQG